MTAFPAGQTLTRLWTTLFLAVLAIIVRNRGNLTKMLRFETAAGSENG
jgi:hypothetical protein